MHVILQAEQVAAARSASPYRPIVALVRADDPAEAIAAQLAGATVVLPCFDPNLPDPDEVDAAVAAAVALTSRQRRGEDEVGDAAHRFASNASAVGMVAHLLGPAGGRRTEQLRSLADQGAALAWRASRGTRTGGRPLAEIDLADVVRSLAIGEADEGIEVTATVAPPTPTVLADREGLERTLDSLVDNARRAGAEHVAVTVTSSPEGVVVEVRDDGSGLPSGWTGALACEPFTSGWATPGDGLGLTVAAELVDDHGGTFVVEDDRDRGVVVRLTLPASPLRSAAHHARPHAETTTDTALSGVLEQITRRAPLSAVLEALGAAVEAEVPGGVASVLLLDRTSSTLHHGAGSRLPAPYREAIDGLPIGPLRGSCGTAAHTRREVVAHDIAVDERWADFKHLALPHGLRSCWSTPIIDDERDLVLGTFAVYRSEPWTPDDAAVSLVARLTHAAAIAIRTTELHQQLTEREALFRGTFENTAVGLALVDPDGRVMQANAALAEMVADAAVGRRFVDLVHPDDVGLARVVLDALEAPGSVDAPRAEVRLLRGDGSPLWTAMSGRVIPRGDGVPSYVCVEVFDLTERRRVAQARREQAMAEAASQAKSELIALVSHELRTPLNAVIGFAQVLRTLELRPDQHRDSVDHIHDAGRHLLQTINDLVDLSGAETGQLPLELGAVSAATACDEAIELVAGLAADRGIDLARDTASGSASGSGDDLWVRADPHRLRQVLVNLLGNAIKFTAPGGSVVVRFDQGSGGATPRIVVADTGCGIAVADQTRLFTPFQRIGSSGEEGSGLGLALSQLLVRAMGGDLGVTSEVGRGSEFWVELPVGAGPGPAHRSNGGQFVADGEVRGRVVYLDDDEASRALLRSALSVWPEVEVITVATCGAAIAELSDAAADVVVLDVELPDGNGWDVLRRLRADADRPAPPALMLTAGPITVPADCRPTDVLSKPVLIPELLDAIRVRLGP